MKNNLPVLILNDAILLPSLELRMDFDSTVDKKLFSICSEIIIIYTIII